MACKVQIKENLTNEIRIKAKPLEGANLKTAKELANNINKSYNYEVVKVFEGANDYTNKVVVTVPEEMVTKYHEYFTKLEEEEARIAQREDAERAGEDYDDNYLFQMEETPSSVASPEVIKKVKQVLDRMGVKVQSLQEYLKGNPNIDVRGVNALADLTRRVIAVAEGKEDIALTEEMVHIATSIIEQQNPKLVTEMISKIGNFSIYSKTLEEYKDNPNYQLPNGKPDIRKIKKEAVDKLITELIVNESEGNIEFPELKNETNRSMIRIWWQKILDWFRGQYKKADINIFEDVAERIMSGKVMGETDKEGIYFQLSDKQKEFQRKIKETSDNIRKVEVKEKADPELLGDEESNNWYERLLPDGTWERLKKRVTDRVKTWYKQRFPVNAFTDEEKEMNEFKRKLGVKFHKYMEEIHKRFFNSDGTRREIIGDRPYIKDDTDEDVYLKLEKYYISLINKHFEDNKKPLVFSEVILYDSVEKEPGTVDLLIVDEDGKSHMYDWKFMSVGKSSNDIPWYKQGAFNIQLGRYKEILVRRYGVKEIGNNRAIPILLDIDRQVKDDPKTRYLKGILIGSVDTNEIEDLKLMPVSEETESTGFVNLDKLIKKMNAIHKQLSKKEVTSDEEREYKLERLNIIKNALRYLQANTEISPLINVISVMRKEGEMIINDWESKYKGKHRTNELTDKELSEFAKDIVEYSAIANVFKDIDKQIGELIYTESMEKEATSPEMKIILAERKNILEKVRNEAQKITNSFNEIENISSEFADKFIGERNLVTGLLESEAVVKTLFSQFTGVSDLPMASLQILYKLMSNAKANAAREATSKVDKLLEIRNKLNKRGGNLRNIVKKIYQKDEKGKSVNKLIYKYSKEFYDQIKANAADDIRSKEWLKQNIDLEAYWKEAKELMDSRIKRYEQIYSDNPTMMEDLILQERRKWDISRKDFIGFDNYILKRHPLEKWKSEEYKELEKDGDLMELYNFIKDINNEAEEIGYIDNRISNTFLPFVRKSFAESLAWDFGLSAIKNWGKSLELRTDDVGYGKVNDVTGEYEYAIPKYYTQDFTRKEDGTRDFSDVSDDLFKNMILYIQHVNQYKYLSDVEGQLKLVKQIEEFKGHLATNRSGNVVFKGGRPEQLEGNEENTKTYDNFMRALLYGQKYPLSVGDAPLGIGKVISSVSKGINKLAGREIIKIDENPSPTSLIKLIDAINRAMQLKTLGLEPISGMANYFGGHVQVMAQAGNYFTGKEFMQNEGKLLGWKFKSKEEQEAYIQLIDTFMPLKDNPLYKRARKAGMSVATRINPTDFIMMAMRYPEMLIENSIFLSLLQNTMVIDGKLVNIRIYVKNKYKRYEPGGRFRQVNRRVNDEINELKRNKSIYVTKKLENGKLVIPGLDLNNHNEVQRLTRLTRRIARNAMADMSDSDLNEMSMNIWTKSMMVFKGWIPKLIKTRFGKLEKISDDFNIEIGEDGMTTGELYDIGRVRLWLYVMGTSVRDMSLNLYNILSVNDKGLERLSEMYDKFAESYEKRTGKPFTMSRDDFYDMVRRNLANQARELAMLLALVSASFALGLIGPDDKESTRADKNFHRYAQKVFDKFVQELSFFYNPIEFQKILSGSTFPAIGLVSDIMKFTNHFVMQTTGYDISNLSLTDDEVRERAQPIKHLMKLFPGTKASLTWGAILSEEWADYFDITIQKESRR